LTKIDEQNTKKELPNVENTMAIPFLISKIDKN